MNVKKNIQLPNTIEYISDTWYIIWSNISHVIIYPYSV